MTNHTIFVDFDSTMVNSIKAFVDVYKERHKHELINGELPFPIHEYVKSWNMQDELPYLKLAELYDIFDSERFFDNLSLFADPNGITMYDFLEQLSYYDNLTVKIASKGHPRNLRFKKEYIKSNFKCFPIDNFIPMDGTDMDKSSLTGLVLIDDHEDNLYTANVKYKILVNFNIHKSKCEWNSRAMDDPNIYKCFSVSDVINTVKEILDFERSVI